jgi:hypothetical protein
VVVVTDDMTQLALPPSFVLQRGSGRVMNGDLVLPDGQGMHMDIGGCRPREVGAYLWFFTGPKELNIAMRAHAMAKGLRLSQYGVFAGGRQVDDGTERGVAEAVGWPWMEPGQRDAWASRVEADDVAVEVKSSDGKRSYRVVVENGGLRCSCPGYTYRRRCWHVDHVKEQLKP